MAEIMFVDFELSDDENVDIGIQDTENFEKNDKRVEKTNYIQECIDIAEDEDFCSNEVTRDTDKLTTSEDEGNFKQ